MPLDCNRAREQMLPFIDGALDQAAVARLHRHLERCARCAAELGEQRALGLLARVGLAGRLRHRPNELSGGERQRVAIARALMNRPAVLFADEPTGNLDGRAGEDILRLLQELNESGQTILMVTHDRELAHRADEVVHLVDGRVQ